MIDRRTLLLGSSALGLASSMGSAAAGPEGAMVFGPQAPFSFDALAGTARELSQQPFRKPQIPDSDLLERLDFDAYQEIRFRPELAIWLHGGGPYPVELFHLGRYFKEPSAFSWCRRTVSRRRFSTVRISSPMAKAASPRPCRRTRASRASGF